MNSITYTIGKPKIALQILSYLVEHPGARDSVEGIVEWWLLSQQIKEIGLQVKEALGELVVEGLILEHNGEGSQTLFSINPEKREAIVSLLQSAEERTLLERDDGKSGR
jgi:hypothetical protein